MSADSHTNSSARKGKQSVWTKLGNTAAISKIADKWSALGGREKTLLSVIVLLLLLLVLWLAVVRPAYNNWKNVQENAGEFEQKLQSMQRISEEAKALRELKSMTTEEAKTQLQKSVDKLEGAGVLTWQGNKGQVAITNASPIALAQWLSAARIDASSLPDTADLRFSSSGWNGTVVLKLPVQQ